MICLFTRQTLQYHSNPSLCPNQNAEESESEWFYDDLQDLLELPPKKDALFITGDWKSKVRSKEIPAVTANFGLGVHNEAGQRLTKFCSKFSKQGFNSMWNMNFQMFKLDLEKIEEPKIKLLTSIGSMKKQKNYRETSTFALLIPPNLWLRRLQQSVENS